MGFSASQRMTISLAVILVEVSNDIRLLLPIMLAILLGHGAMLMWNVVGVPAALWMKSRGEMAVTKGYGIYASKPKAT